MPQTLEKKTYTHKVADYEELLPEEEAAIEEGRKAYARGEWINFRGVKKNGMANSRNKTRTKKS